MIPALLKWIGNKQRFADTIIDMQAFDEYRNKDASFWALIKFVSEGLGYTDRRRGTVKSFSPNEVVSFCSKDHHRNLAA